MQDGQSYVYYGLGGRLKAVEADPRAGVRLPLGITYINPQEPIDVFFEIVPILDILPETRLAMNIGLGGRFYLRGRSTRY